ncbi:hypothetical protein CU098_006119, partial [Rhizopus stolonifer]
GNLGHIYKALCKSCSDTIPVLDFSADDSIMVNNRDYNNAFLNACQAADWNNHDNKRLFTIMNTYGLHRIALMNYDNYFMNCTYTELTNDMAAFLNQDWSIHKSMSLRLDAPFDPEVGPNVVSFDLNDSSKAKITTIPVKESARKEAAEVAQNNNAAFIAPYDLIYQLRQLGTRFHQQSAYFLCQESNETVDNLAARPYTICTLAEWDSDNDNANYRTVFKLFQTIAINVEGTAVYYIFQSILTQFSDGTAFITIIGSESSSREL